MRVSSTYISIWIISLNSDHICSRVSHLKLTKNENKPLNYSCDAFFLLLTDRKKYDNIIFTLHARAFHVAQRSKLIIHKKKTFSYLYEYFFVRYAAANHPESVGEDLLLWPLAFLWALMPTRWWWWWFFYGGGGDDNPPLFILCPPHSIDRQGQKKCNPKCDKYSILIMHKTF